MCNCIGTQNVPHGWHLADHDGKAHCKHHHVSIFPLFHSHENSRGLIQGNGEQKPPLQSFAVARTQWVIATVVRKGQKDFFRIVLGRGDGNRHEDDDEAGQMKKDEETLERRELLRPPDVEGGDQSDQQDA